MNWKNHIDQSSAKICSVIPIKDFQNPKVYAWWLSQTYHFVCHSTSLLGYSLPFLKDEKLKAIYEHHLGEESRHDLLALKDIAKLGMKLSPPAAMTEAFYQSQYYRIQFEGGHTLLGYILFLENLAVTWGKELHHSLKDTHPQSMLFLRVHAEEDVSHVARALDLIQTLSTRQQEEIYANFHFSQALYSSLISEGKFIKLGIAA